MVGCKCLCVCWLQGREHYSGDSGFGGGPACRGVQGGLPQDSLSLPDVPVAGTGLQVGGQLECGGGIFNLHSPVPSSGPPPALCPSPWRLAAVRGGQGLGGGGLGGLCLGGFCLYQLCFSCMQGSGAPTPLWGGHGAVGRPSAPEPRVEGLASRPAAWAGGNGLCQPLPWHPGGNTQPRPPPPCAGISRVHQTPLQGGGRPRAGVVVVGVIWVPGGATRQHH